MSCGRADTHTWNMQSQQSYLDAPQEVSLRLQSLPRLNEPVHCSLGSCGVRVPVLHSAFLTIKHVRYSSLNGTKELRFAPLRFPFQWYVHVPHLFQEISSIPIQDISSTPNISRGTEWCKFQLCSTFHFGSKKWTKNELDFGQNALL